jgi:hypothetical protein
MAQQESKIVSQQRFVSGISDFPKEGIDAFVYQDGIAIDHRHDPRAITLLPASLKESGTIITDLIKWSTVYPSDLTSYMYGNTGNIYSRTTTPTYTLLHQVPSSHGNGIFYYPEDDYVYYSSDSSIGRYGPLSLGSPQFVDNYFQAQGGVPTNTNSLSLVSSSSQYASHIDASAFDITGDIAMGCYIYPTTLPTAGNTMSLMAKWDQSTSHESYKFGLGAVSGYFGSGTDGALTISSNTTDSPIDSACTGSSGTQTLSATNASFAIGQVILIHQTKGTGAGVWERNIIQGYTAGTITTTSALKNTYSSGAQVIVMKQYSSVTVNSGKTWTAKAWNGTVGGILAFICSGTVAVAGSVSANGCGFRGGSGVGPVPSQADGTQGEGTPGIGTNSDSANGNGGGTSFTFVGALNYGAGGAGGGNGTVGTNGTSTPQGTGGTGGSAVGSVDLTTMSLAGGGGAGGVPGDNSSISGAGGAGGGIVFITGATITVSGSIISNGGVGTAGTNNGGGGGGGAGGSILLKAQAATLGTSLITANGGDGGSGNGAGGSGGTGRIHVDYYTSYTGTTTPTLNATQDSNLITNTTYQLQLSISSDGTTSETLTQNINLQTLKWQHVAVSWASASSMATFYLNAVSQGTATGTKTAIHNNASAFYLGADKGASAVGNFYNGLIDDAMLFNTQETSTLWTTVLSQQLATNTPGLAFYAKLNNDLNDSTSNGNNLTGTNTPTFSSNVPYPGATTRLDIDQTQTGTGNTYTVPTSISESASGKISFTPSHDPQKSMQVSINTVGSGNWTLTIHDSLNNTVSSVTVANASLHTGNYEFTFATPWRTLTNFTNIYHAHFASTVADGSIDCLTSANVSTAAFTTYYSFLVTDTAWHPINQMLNQMVIGNERYIATYNGLASSYNPNTLVLPAAWRVKCFALWNEYIAIGCFRGNSITDFDQGRIYFWDGSALTFNFFIEVPEGGVNALLSRGASLYAWCGYSGYIFEYQSGLEGDKVKRIPHMEESDTVEIYPGAVTTWRTLVRFGVGGSVSSSTVNRGVYSWGSFLTMGFFQQLYRQSLSLDYVISTGNYGSSVTIGLVTPIQNKLLIGWQDGSSYGVDYVSYNNNPASSGSIKLLLSDDGETYKQKGALTLVAQHLPLNSGESVQVEVATDRGTYQLSGFNSTVGSTKTSLNLTGVLYNEYVVGVDLATTVSTSPKITGIAFERDPADGAIKLQTE